MNFIRYFLLFLVSIIILAGCQPAVVPPEPTLTAVSPTATSVPAPTQTNEDLIKLAWFYKPPAEEEYPDIVGRFDFFILTNRDEPEREDIRSLGEDGPFNEYLLLASIQDPGSCTAPPNGNQVAFRRGDFCWISAEHPDWFLLDTEGKRVPNSDGDYFYMDPGHPGFRAFWLERARELQETYNWDGLFLDNVEASLSKYERKDFALTQYQDDASLQEAVEGFLIYLDQNYFTPQNRTVYANIISTRDPQIWHQYLTYLDGAMIENFAVDWNTYFSTEEWEQQIQMILEAQANGKKMILVAQGDEKDIERQEFAFATYLLVANGDSAFRYAHHSAYREIWWYDTYELELGRALGPAYKDGDFWTRSFSNGFVTVDPETQTASIEVNTD